MENNYYLSIEAEYDKVDKGHFGKFSYRSCFHHKYLKVEDTEALIKEIKKSVDTSNYMITISIDNLDWTGQPIGICRILNEYGKIKYVSWDERNSYCRDCNENRYIDKKEIKSIINNVFDRFNAYVNHELTN